MHRGVVVGCFLLVALAACVGPVRTDRVYESKAVETAKAVRSAVETAELAAKAAGTGRASGQYTSVLLADTEKDADGAASAFDSIQPPSAASEALHSRLAAVVGTATDALRELRVASRRTDLAGVAKLARGLAAIARRLAEFIASHG